MSDLLWADVISSTTNDDYFLIQIWQRVVWWSVLEIEKIDMGEGGLKHSPYIEQSFTK